MRKKEFKRKPLNEWVAYSLAAASVVGSTLVYAASPAAGTEIKNLATVTYEDVLGNKYSAQSNEAVITVAAQHKAEFEKDTSMEAAPGQTVYVPQILTNTGNETDTYTVTAVDNTDPANPVDLVVYVDTNGNGQADSGEPIVDPTKGITLEAGEVANLVVAYPVATDAAKDEEKVVEVTATSSNATAVLEDIGDNSDGEDQTDNVAKTQSTIKVATDAVLVSTKSAVVDKVNSEITYTLTTKNVGGSDATEVIILDALPMVDHDNDPATPSIQTELKAGSVILNGFMDPADTQLANAVTDESALTFDVNGDGGTADVPRYDSATGAGNTIDAPADVISVVDATLEINTTVSVQFTVKYDPTWEAGSDIENTFVAYPNPSPDPANPIDPTDPTAIPEPPAPGDPGAPTPSNKTLTDVPATVGAGLSDTGKDASPGVNDGGDDDADDTGNIPDGTQTIDTAPAGATLEYPLVVTNSGNGDDIFNLTTDPATNTFPEGSVITYWNADGTVQLTDTDGDGIPDTGLLDPGEIANITVKVDLPSGASSPTEVGATVTATSSTDPTVTAPANIVIKEITKPAVDLAAVMSANVLQPDTGIDQTDPAVAAENAHSGDGPVGLTEAAPGDVVSVPLQLVNESGSSESYLLGSTDVPDGWTVVYKDENGAIINSTPFIPAGEAFKYTAEITVPTDATKALADAPATGPDGGTNVNGYDASNNEDPTDLTTTDTDLDYVIGFTVASASDNSVDDAVAYAVDVVPSDRELTVTPDGQNQVAPGGTVDYKHSIDNTGNTDKEFEIVVDNSEEGWNSVVLIDTDGDGIPETNISQLPTDGTGFVTVTNPDGTKVQVAVTDTDGDGNPEIPLTPGQSVDITNKVYAPSDSAEGVVNTSKVMATDPTYDPANPDSTLVNATATDSSSVITGQVRLDKTVAIDVGCDGTADEAFTAAGATAVEPGQCAIWKLVAKNEGSANVKNVVITDDVPEYTVFESGSLQYCQGVGANCTLTTLADTGANVSHVAGNIIANVGTDAKVVGTNSADGDGGVLVPGDEATVMFSVKIE